MGRSIDLRGGSGAARARTLSAYVPTATTGLLYTVSRLGLLAPVTFAKTGGSSNLSINTSTGGVSAAAGLGAAVAQTLNGTATGADNCVIPFALTLTGAVPAPVFSVQPSISPGSGLVGATFTATDGTADNTTSYTRRWLLGGVAIGTGATVAPVLAGTLTLEVTAHGPGGNTIATSSGVTVSNDTTPDAFSFTDVSSAALATQYTSDTITVAGLTSGISVAVTIAGGTYSKNGGAYTSAAGTAQNGDTFAVRQTSSASNSTQTDTTLTIGGVSDTFSVTTLAGGGGGGGDAGGTLLNLLFALT